VARGLVGCVAACAAARGVTVDGLVVAVQGAGAIGAAVARALAARGASIVIADVDVARAHDLADALGAIATVIAPDDVLAAEVDVLAPCAIGGVIDDATAAQVQAWAVCGAANNVFAGEQAVHVLHDRGVLVVPDVLASAGAVIDGIGASVMHLGDRTPLIDALGTTAAALLAESRATGRTTTELATSRARGRIAAARRS
jgi:leucine dehydrogenase